MGDQGSTPAIYAARPQILIDGRADSELSSRLLELLVEETTAGLYRCEAVFGNVGTPDGEAGYRYVDGRTLDFGKALAVRAGAGDAEAQIFSGRITGLEGGFSHGDGRPPTLAALAEDRFQDLRMTRRTRTFEDSSDADVIRRVAQQHGLQAQIDLSGPSHSLIAQVNQSDLAFLRERARVAGAELWVQGDTLRAQPRARRRAGEVTLTYGEGLIEMTILADLAHQRTSLAVSGWDVAAKEGISEEADEQAVAGELGGGQSGAAALRRAFGERPERIVHMTPLTSQEARALAEAQYRTIARRFVSGRGVCEGDGRVRVGGSLRLGGLGPRFNGVYYVAEVQHSFNLERGYRTHFAVERPGLGQG